MNTRLIIRKSSVLTLAVLVILLAAAVFHNGLTHTAANAAQQTSNPSSTFGVSLTSASVNLGHISPLARAKGFAPLGGRKVPAALDGRKPPPAAQDGRKTPASLDGRRVPAALANPFATQVAPLTLVDGMFLLALAALLLVPPARKASLLRK
jgi:hypothetical protein